MARSGLLLLRRQLRLPRNRLSGPRMVVRPEKTRLPPQIKLRRARARLFRTKLPMWGGPRRRITGSRGLKPADPDAKKKKSCRDLASKLEQLKRDLAIVRALDEETTRSALTGGGVSLSQKANEIVDVLDRHTPLAGDSSVLSRPPALQTWVRAAADPMAFLPFNKPGTSLAVHREIQQSLEANTEVPPPVVSNHPTPMTAEEELPYLQAFSPLTLAQVVTTLPREGRKGPHLQNRLVTITSTNPTGFFAAQIELTVDVDTTDVVCLAVPRLDEASARELSPFIEKVIRGEVPGGSAVGKSVPAEPETISGLPVTTKAGLNSPNKSGPHTKTKWKEEGPSIPSITNMPGLLGRKKASMLRANSAGSPTQEKDGTPPQHNAGENPPSRHEGTRQKHPSGTRENVSILTWAMGEWLRVAMRRARFWCLLERELGDRDAILETVARLRARRRKKRRRQELEDDDDDEDGNDSSSGGADVQGARKLKSSTDAVLSNAELRLHMGRTSMDLGIPLASAPGDGAQTRLRVQWQIVFDWAGNARSRIGILDCVPSKCEPQSFPPPQSFLKIALYVDAWLC